jgi:hypothetical protein
MAGLLEHLRKITSTCGPDTNQDDLLKALSEAQGWTDKGLRFGELLKADSSVFQKLKSANDALGQVMKYVGKGWNICKDVRALITIRDAMEALDSATMERNPKKAAAAFDALFSAVGQLCRHIPVEGGQWAVFFQNMGNFFGNINRLYDLSTRPGTSSQYCEINKGGAVVPGCPSRPPD